MGRFRRLRLQRASTIDALKPQAAFCSLKFLQGDPGGFADGLLRIALGLGETKEDGLGLVAQTLRAEIAQRLDGGDAHFQDVVIHASENAENGGLALVAEFLAHSADGVQSTASGQTGRRP